MTHENKYSPLKNIKWKSLILTLYRVYFNECGNLRLGFSHRLIYKARILENLVPNALNGIPPPESSTQHFTNNKYQYFL